MFVKCLIDVDKQLMGGSEGRKDLFGSHKLLRWERLVVCEGQVAAGHIAPTAKKLRKMSAGTHPLPFHLPRIPAQGTDHPYSG